MKRIKSIDVVRGIVMIIMALDHVRDLMHVNSITQSPTNLETTTPILFFTRWITYLCAPTFVFLAGTSAWLSLKKNGISQSRSFLLKRGLYLVMLEFIVVNFALFFDPAYHTLFFEVIAAIGFGFIVIGLLLKAPLKWLGIAGLVIIFCHSLVSFLPFAEHSMVKTILMPFFTLSVFPMFSNRVFVMAYPPVPWLGIMLVGFASGKFFEMANEKRKTLFVKIGLGALLLFIFLRYLNIYGDPVVWSAQKSSVFTFLSFMNIAKYPPSLLFCLATLGIMFIMLDLAERAKNKLWEIVSVYGKVPLFYFLAHFFLIHILMLAMMFLQGFSWSQLDFAAGNFGRLKNVESGVRLWVIYLIWIGVVVIMYKPCVWFGKYKAEHTYWWLKYI